MTACPLERFITSYITVFITFLCSDFVRVDSGKQLVYNNGKKTRLLVSVFHLLHKLPTVFSWISLRECMGFLCIIIVGLNWLPCGGANGLFCATSGLVFAFS